MRGTLGAPAWTFYEGLVFLSERMCGASVFGWEGAWVVLQHLGQAGFLCPVAFASIPASPPRCKLLPLGQSIEALGASGRLELELEEGASLRAIN